MNNIKNNNMKTELGQMLYRTPTGSYETPRFVDALIEDLLNEIERAYWNVSQEEWERFDNPKLYGVVYKSYYWGEDEKEAEKPNLTFNFSPQEIRWYKYPGRGQSSTVEWNEKEWVEWYNKGLEVIKDKEKNN